MTFEKTITFVSYECPGCNVAYALAESFDKERRNSHKGFYCPNGCVLSYKSESELERTKKEVERLQNRVENLQERNSELYQESTHKDRRFNGLKGAMARVKNRVAKGVCPCCNRHFSNLHQHMKNQHPTFAE